MRLILHLTPLRSSASIRASSRIVHLLQHHVFEGDPSSPHVAEALHIGNQVLKRVNPVDGHKPRAERVRGSVERDRELRFLGIDTAEAVNETDCGNSEAPAGDIETQRFLHDFDSLQHIVDIIEGLAHAHENDIGDPVLTLVRPDRHCLAHDLGWGKVPHEADPARHAEFARHLAAHLGGQAQGAPPILRHEHALHEMAVKSGEEEFHGTVLRGDGLPERGQLEKEHALQSGPKLLRQICHAVEVSSLRLVDPLVDLSRPVGRKP